MPAQKSQEIRLKSRPAGMPGPENFELAEATVPAPGAGQVQVRNIFMSVDPYMRGRMVDRKSYTPPFRLGEALSGGAIGQVVEAGPGARFAVGDYVSNFNGWREWFVSDGADLEKIDPTLAPIQAYLGTFGMPGLTAYAGLLRVGALKEGERVFVSAAAGAVGTVVCQIAKNKGCYVVGSAGSDDKCDWLRSEARVDATINYKTCGNLMDAVGKAFPQGIDVYFENVGGAHLEAALAHMRPHGRIAVCGMIEQYNATELPPGPRTMIAVVPNRLRIEGFIVSDHGDLMGDFLRDMSAWAKEGRLKWHETIYDGIARAPEAFMGLFKGANFGKMLVRLAPDKVV
jgi:NADPH-dependent curcumin reductase CurA